MGLDLTSFADAMKIKYSDAPVRNMVYKRNPFMAMVSKMENFGGSQLNIPIIYGNPMSRSGTFATAQTKAATSSSGWEGFQITRVHDYGVVQIDNETLEASKGNEHAFARAVTSEVDSIVNSLGRSAATSMFRTGYGALGQFSSLSTLTITLVNPNDIVNFEVGMTLKASNGSTETNALRTSGTATMVIDSIDRSAGTFTVATAAITSLTANDYLFVDGDRADAAYTTQARPKIVGLEGWLPATSPTSTAFFGVNRALDVTRLGGQRLNAATYPIEEALVEGAVIVAREGGALDKYFMSYSTYTALEKALGSKVQYVDLKVNAEVGFRGVRINGPSGPIDCVPDQNCPTNRVFGLQMDTWKLYSLGRVPRAVPSDGVNGEAGLRQASADGVEIRWGYYAQLGCTAPGYNINIQV